jgi:hypothetical protein
VQVASYLEAPLIPEMFEMVMARATPSRVATRMPSTSIDCGMIVSGHVLEGWSGEVGPRQEIVDAFVWVAVDDPGDDVGEVSLRFDANELASLDQRSNDRPVLAASVGAGEESVFPVQRDRADGAFHDV